MSAWFSDFIGWGSCWGALLGALCGMGLPGCGSSRPPSASMPGLYSTTTALENLTADYTSRQSLFDDHRAITFQPLPACPRDTTGVVIRDWGDLKTVSQLLPLGMPGAILLTRDGWGIDEAEVPNIEWKRYQQRLLASGSAVADTQPAAAALPVPDYFTNSFYDYCPVVGLSYEQVQAFCTWRGQVITKMINRNRPGSPDSLAAEHVVVEARLPTEAEWELAALAKRGLPYGTRCTETAIEVNPKAAAYLQMRASSTASVAQITADIKAYNRTRPMRSVINSDQPEPYFLRLAAPAYVYGGLTNDYKLFNLLGNVAEMVQERGLAKGGSYRDPLAACTATSRSRYAGPAPTVGFRCVVRATQPNRK